ncbi:MAG TPA: sigma-70 family RNA polymerase sigma factor, partial [Caulobacteraceae bacterium]|nr:sigma-70 family RNA polymerase sigma factor [Caulobacteraceae bacterium]
MQHVSLAMMKDDTAEDADLLRAHQAGDLHAFARLYDRYDRPCFRFVCRLLGAAQTQAAEDLHQETWIAVSRNAASFDPAKASFAAWLYTIARHKTFDHFRRQKVAVMASVIGEAAMTV